MYKKNAAFPIPESDPYRMNLVLLRKKHGYTQAKLAEKLGTSQTMYARYERGANELPIHHLILLAKIYGVSTDQILGLEKDRP